MTRKGYNLVQVVMFKTLLIKAIIFLKLNLVQVHFQGRQKKHSSINKMSIVLRMKHLELKQKVNNVNLKKGVYQYNAMAEQKLHMSFISKIIICYKRI